MKRNIKIVAALMVGITVKAIIQDYFVESRLTTLIGLIITITLIYLISVIVDKVYKRYERD